MELVALNKQLCWDLNTPAHKIIQHGSPGLRVMLLLETLETLFSHAFLVFFCHNQKLKTVTVTWYARGQAKEKRTTAENIDGPHDTGG